MAAGMPAEAGAAVLLMIGLARQPVERQRCWISAALQGEDVFTNQVCVLHAGSHKAMY
jgi:hypothetical protein